VYTGQTVQRQQLILVVEDDADLRRMYTLALIFEGFEVLQAVDGIDALQQIEQRPPDLVVLDLGLPRLGGLCVQQEIAAQAVTHDIPIVVVTGLNIDLELLDVLCVLRKPVTMEQLVSTVQRCLQVGSGEGSAVRRYGSFSRGAADPPSVRSDSSVRNKRSARNKR
jgi:DNA-binding response OmpR family regulator